MISDVARGCTFFLKAEGCRKHDEAMTSKELIRVCEHTWREEINRRAHATGERPAVIHVGGSLLQRYRVAKGIKPTVPVLIDGVRLTG